MGVSRWETRTPTAYQTIFLHFPTLQVPDTNYIQLFRERLSDKVHATTPKGIVGGFKFTFFQKKIDRMAGEAMDIRL